jgi:hypothetical protein
MFHDIDASSPKSFRQRVRSGDVFSGTPEPEPLLPEGPGQVCRSRMLRSGPSHQTCQKLQVRSFRCKTFAAVINTEAGKFVINNHFRVV